MEQIQGLALNKGETMTREEYETMYRELLTPLQAKLMQLDAALTGKPKDAEHHARQSRFTPDRFVSGELYYLSDGGYSRLACDVRDVLTVQIFLTSESIQSTRVNWITSAALVQAVKDEIKTWLESEGW